MNKYSIGFIIVVIIGVVVYAVFSYSKDNGIKTENESAMMEKEDGGEMTKEDKMMSDDTNMEEEMMNKEDNMMEDTMIKSGTYESYSSEKIATAESKNVVLFFRASWCPTCRALDSNIKSNLENIPSDVIILDVDYDSSSSLKQKYEITYQHTLVQVDAKGNMIKKWSGSPTLAALVAEIR